MTQFLCSASNPPVNFLDHLRTTGSALKNWLVVQSTDALIVGVLWLIGLEIIRVPLAPLWAVLGALLQFVPHFGPVTALIGPALVGGISGGWMRLIYVLILYAVIAVTDGLFLQPYLMKRTAKVPVWSSILMPFVLGFVIPFWGVLLAPPLLAVVYTYRNRMTREPELSPKPCKEQFPVGTKVQVKDEGSLRQFQERCKSRRPISLEQIETAGQVDVVTNVGFYRGGDVLYKLQRLPGIWHEECLEPAGLANLPSCYNPQLPS